MFNYFSQVKKPMNDPGFDDKLIHFGFSVGLNTMDYRITNYKEVTQNPVFDNNQALLNNALGYYGSKKNHR